MITRTTVYIDESLMNRVRSHVTPRGLSALINELLTERVRQRDTWLPERNERNSTLTGRPSTARIGQDELSTSR